MKHRQLEVRELTTLRRERGEVSALIRRVGSKCENTDMCPLYLLDKHMADVMSPQSKELDRWASIATPNKTEAAKEAGLRQLILERLLVRVGKTQRQAQVRLNAVQHTSFMMNVDAAIQTLRNLGLLLEDLENGPIED